MIDDGDRHTAPGQGDEQPATTGPESPSGTRPTQPPTETRRRSALALAGVLVVVAVVVSALFVHTRSTTSADPAPLASSPNLAGDSAISAAEIVSPRPVTDEQLATLPQATTYSTTAAAPRDPAPGHAPGGRVAHPTRTVPVFAEPGGEPVAAVPAHQPLGIEPNLVHSDTWLSVVDEQPGWALVTLPSRPNNSVAWMFTDTDAVTLATTPYLITVDRAAFELTLTIGGQVSGRWKVGIGKPDAVTPAGRTFLLAALRDEKSPFSTVVLPLGSHSDTHQSFGGGPGTVAFHSWPTADVYGTASSDGCVRVPADALQALTDVPSGTTVLIK
ncbi:L,D-transpeptidase [Lentzea flaviverrucosa]|uniref:L,D-transpeptidase catalytic domain n=1 Tax=Lentzea flaviverrucosa TaxID=200379 RepID=A0A1H9ESZ7_9PSEU|nr:L,D-transpeptidase [Lentzea flaviverrucosa]RDI35405.1 L,D-transpeptidase-like protein [Lentzea flaviverrucosa]SEQ28722.1 L,D-transpeptidase catalytic domain [Lentzea flaviverrucosa]